MRPVSPASIPGTYIFHWDCFLWDSQAGVFEGHINVIGGFTGEHFDGEAMGFGIEGKTGQIEYFRVAEERTVDGRVVAWRVVPTSTNLRGLISHGVIHNC